MKISAINNNQFKTVNNNNRQNNNISFNGIKEIGTALKEPVSSQIAALGVISITILGGIASALTVSTEKNETINEIGNFINSDNYNKDSLKVKDYTNDGVLDFELVDKDGKKVIYDAKKNELLEYTTTLQEIK